MRLLLKDPELIKFINLSTPLAMPHCSSLHLKCQVENYIISFTQTSWLLWAHQHEIVVSVIPKIPQVVIVTLMGYFPAACSTVVISCTHTCCPAVFRLLLSSCPPHTDASFWQNSLFRVNAL